jgi:hypothetical protein
MLVRARSSVTGASTLSTPLNGATIEPGEQPLGTADRRIERHVLAGRVAVQGDVQVVNWGLNNNGTAIGVKDPRGASLTPMAVPMSLATATKTLVTGLSAVGDLARSRPYGAVYAGGVPDG